METAKWIDLQVNGYGGIDFNSPGLDVEKVIAITRRLADDGTAAYLPTLVTGNPETVCTNLRVIAEARRTNEECGQRILGVHLEGPFISDKPGAVGAHATEWVHKPDIALFNRFMDAADGAVKIVTVAAEIPGMTDFIKDLVNRGITVSLGHQMAAVPSDINPAIEAGAKAFTHLGNGLPGMIPRHNNIIFTALADDRATVMFIPDGHHLPDSVLKVYYRSVPLSRLVAVSDSQFPAGMPPGDYEVGGLYARLEPDGLLWNPERNCLVGATTPMAKMMKLLQDRIGLTEAECYEIGHNNPLKLIGETSCKL